MIIIILRHKAYYCEPNTSWFLEEFGSIAGRATIKFCFVELFEKRTGVKLPVIMVANSFSNYYIACHFYILKKDGNMQVAVCLMMPVLSLDFSGE
jgi:hypothetical protein